MGYSNLAKKILAVMKDLEYIQKDDRIKFGSTDYRAVSEGAVLKKVRPLLIKHGLVIIPCDITDVTVENKITSATFRYTIIDQESGESAGLVALGQGHDSADKGAGKAATYAGKYLLLKTFWIETGEDPDKTSSEEIKSKQSAKKAPDNAKKTQNNAKKAPNKEDYPSDFDAPPSGEQVQEAVQLRNSLTDKIMDLREKGVISASDASSYVKRINKRAAEADIEALKKAKSVIEGLAG